MSRKASNKTSECESGISQSFSAWPISTEDVMFYRRLNPKNLSNFTENDAPEPLGSNQTCVSMRLPRDLIFIHK